MIVNTPPLIVGMARTFGDSIDRRLILETAAAMNDRGLVRAGYRYLNIGDGWAQKKRGDSGELKTDVAKLGCELGELAEELEKYGVSLAIVTSGGTRTPGGYPGSFGHEYEDAGFFTNSGVKLISHDFSTLPHRVDPVTMVRRMGMALRTCGDKVMYSVFTNGDTFVRMIRSTGAHLFCGKSFTEAEGVGAPPPETFGYSVPGSLYNCGEIRLGVVADLKKLKKSLIIAAMASSSITVDFDVRNADDDVIRLLTDPDIVSVATDAECRPARLMADFPEAVYLKYLDGNRYAAAFINDGEEDRDILLFAHDIGLTRDSNRTFRAVGAAGSDFSESFSDDLTVSLEPGGSVLLFLNLEKKAGGDFK